LHGCLNPAIRDVNFAEFLKQEEIGMTFYNFNYNLSEFQSIARQKQIVEIILMLMDFTDPG